MSNVLTHRVKSNRAFYNIEVDYADPILITESKGRRKKLIKPYIPLFFAQHRRQLELVTGWTAESFINAVKRFVARLAILLWTMLQPS